MPPGEEHATGRVAAAFTVLRDRGAPVNVVQPVRRDRDRDERFTRALGLRLRRLKDREDDGGDGGGRRSRRAPAPAPEPDRPRFVTTVKTGQYLLPPPELASLLGLETLYPRDRLVYSYASKPQAVAARSRPPPAPAAGGPCGRAFAGVRALLAGVAGLTPPRHTDGSMATATATATATTTHYSNVMHEKRVVRGSTFGAHPLAAGDGVESGAGRGARTRRRALARRAAAARLRPGTPPPAPGRRHHHIQTEYYLEELFDKGVELEVGVQTDLYAERPATPVYVPAKTGADATTQIYPGDLFDFELEVQPILEALVGRTSEQALAEVAQEEELEALREQRRRYAEARDAERAERARLAAQDARLRAERGRRVAQARAQASAALGARDRAAAAALAHGYLAELLPAVLAGLRDQGYLVERVRRGLDEDFLPWLEREVAREMEAIVTSRDVIAEIVRDVVEARADLYRAAEGDLEPDSVTPPSEPSAPSEERKATPW